MTKPMFEYALDAYQAQAKRTAAFGTNPMYPFFGLSEEAGEVHGKIAKFIRHNNGLDPFKASSFVKFQPECVEWRDGVVKELGDCLWMVAMCADVLGLSLSQIAAENITKLEDRANRGVIDGSGDER